MQCVIKEQKGLDDFGMLIWALWFRRNRLGTEDKPLPIGDVRPMTKQILADFTKANPVVSPPSSAIQRSQVRWFKPASPLVKINFDSVIFKELGIAGIGVVVRDSQGLVLASISDQICLPQSIAKVVAIATMRVVQFTQELSLSSIIFEGDFEIIIKTLCSQDESFSSYGHLIAKSKVCLDSFIFCRFTHIHKQGNFVAHNIVRHARHISSISV